MKTIAITVAAAAVIGIILFSFGYARIDAGHEGIKVNLYGNDKGVDAINAKNKAVQDALKIENEVKSVEAEAKKQIASAKGEADALKIN